MRPQAELPPDPPSAPSTRAPAGSCDCHVHLVAAPDEFPLWEGRSEDPAPGDSHTWIARYRRVQATLGTTRAVIVQSIFYGTDLSVTEAAIAALGQNRCRGVGLVPDDADTATLDRLIDHGIVAVRLNATLKRGVMTFDGLRALAPRLADRGLHAQILVHAGEDLTSMAPALAALPVPVVLDHIGWPDLSHGPNQTGFQTLVRLVGEGKAMVKLSAAYRMCEAPYRRVDPFVQTLVCANPEACLWGSDWPHLMLDGAAMPDAGTLLDAFIRTVGTGERLRQILVLNPETIYGFDPADRDYAAS